jgi:hypothetical protein
MPFTFFYDSNWEKMEDSIYSMEMKMQFRCNKIEFHVEIGWFDFARGSRDRILRLILIYRELFFFEKSWCQGWTWFSWVESVSGHEKYISSTMLVRVWYRFGQSLDNMIKIFNLICEIKIFI